MRHTSLLGQPKPVPLLPPGMVFPAPLGLLIPPAGLPHRLFSRLTTAGIRAVPLPAIAVRAHHHLASASVAAQQSSVVRGPAASPTERRARCESSSKALYFPPAGLVPRGGSGLGFLHRFGPAADLFLSNGLSPSLLSTSPASNRTTDHDRSTTITLVHRTNAVAVRPTTDRLDSRPRLTTLSSYTEPRAKAGIARVLDTVHILRVNGNAPPVLQVQQDTVFEDDHESSVRLPVVSAVERGLGRLNGRFGGWASHTRGKWPKGAFNYPGDNFFHSIRFEFPITCGASRQTEKTYVSFGGTAFPIISARYDGG